MRLRIGTVAAAATAAALLAALVPAQGADLGAAVLKNRQDAMKALGGDMKAINEALEAATFDAAAAQAGAASLADHIQNVQYLFVPGTGVDDGVGKTAAKMEIWAEWDKFTQGAANAEAEVAALVAAAAGGDKDAIAAAFGNVGKNGCGGCHTPYRLKQE
jgi:cytochrome c556